MTMGEHTEAKAVADLVRELIPPKLMTVAAEGLAVDVLVAPKGLEVTSVKELVDEYRKKPERIIGTAQLTELDSFIVHVIRFSDENSALFADRTPTAPALVAVYDYHPVADGEAGAAKEARFCGHRARYCFPISDEWKAWTEASGKQMGQAAFSEFLENRIADVVDPISALESSRAIVDKLLCTFAGPSRLVDLAKGLSVRVESIVANKQDLQSGESVIRFETTHKDDRGAPLEVPGAFLLQLPVFRRGAAYQIAARLRYRVREGKITWWFDLFRTAETFDHAFGEACERAAKESEVPLFYGTPESR
jgi:uncharacterized protein YfdQ (DUF2303 family)